MNLWDSISGMMNVELTSADPEAALAAAAEQGIAIGQIVRKEPLILTFWIRRWDVPVLQRLCEKRGDRLKLSRHAGIYWEVRHFFKRPILLLTILLLLFLTLWLPTRVLFIRVEGNCFVPAKKILETAETLGIRFCASRREIRSEQMKNALLGEIPELQWAGINTRGCTAVISVRERPVEEKTEQESPFIRSIAASRDGIIVSCNVWEGTGKCVPGQAVQRGEILISGFTDCGICIRAVRARGEVYARTGREICAWIPSQWQTRRHAAATDRCLTLILGKKRINLWKGSGILEGSCDRIEKEYPLVLPGGFRLPVSVAVEELTYYDTGNTSLDEASAGNILSSFSEVYLSNQMTGGQILSGETSIAANDTGFFFTGQYSCLEMIGRPYAEKLGDNYGESS